MKAVIYIFITILVVTTCPSAENSEANQLVGGPCEGCEAIYEYGDKRLTAIDTLPKFQETEPKLKIKGTIYQKDGKTPAENVILYIYHTNRRGIYETKGDEKGWARRHGYIRGWIRTKADGRYTFYTFRPGAYPDLREPEHIHITVKEPGRNEYYIDDILFMDDSLLTTSVREDRKDRGGNGIVQPNAINGKLTVQRDIILGLNIPNYE